MNEIEIHCAIHHETDEAMLICDGDKEVWIPKVFITDECEEKGRIISIFIPEWLALDKGLI